MDAKDYDQAQKYYSKALQIRKENLPRSKAVYRETVFCIGWLAMETGDYSTALEKFDEVIRLPGSRPQRDRLLVWAEIGRTAADLEQQLGEKDADSKQLSLKLLPGVAEMLALEGDSDWKEAYHLMLGGAAARKNKQNAAAATAFRQCDDLIRERKGAAHYYRTIPLFFLADVLEQDGQLDEAARTYEECLNVAEKSVGPSHGQFPIMLKAYAALLHRQGKTQKAHDYFERVLKEVETRFGKTHFFVAHAKMTYAEFLRQIKDYARLEQQCREAKAIYDDLEKWEEHSRYKTCLELLAESAQRKRKKTRKGSMIRPAPWKHQFNSACFGHQSRTKSQGDARPLRLIAAQTIQNKQQRRRRHVAVFGEHRPRGRRRFARQIQRFPPPRSRMRGPPG